MNLQLRECFTRVKTPVEGSWFVVHLDKCSKGGHREGGESEVETCPQRSLRPHFGFFSAGTRN